MMHLNRNLTTRQYERNDIGRAVEFIVAPEHRSQVTLSATAASSGPHVLTGRARDISPGGIGVECGQYLPRMCEGTLRIYGENPASNTVHFEHRVKVRRVYMISRQPTYALGLAFVSPGPDISNRIDELLAAMNAQQSAEAGDDA